MDANAAATTYRYPPARLVPDGLRALAGFVVTAGPLAFATVLPWVAWLLAAGALLFAGFAVLTLTRVRIRVRVDDHGIEARPGRGPLAWNRLKRVRLRYFQVRREREREPAAGRRPGYQKGWMQLTLREEEGKSLRIDSRLEGFDDIVRRAARAVAMAGLEPDPATRANFAAMGCALAGEDDGEARGAEERHG